MIAMVLGAFGPGIYTSVCNYICRQLRVSDYGIDPETECARGTTWPRRYEEEPCGEFEGLFQPKIASDGASDWWLLCKYLEISIPGRNLGYQSASSDILPAGLAACEHSLRIAVRLEKLVEEWRLENEVGETSEQERVGSESEEERKDYVEEEHNATKIVHSVEAEIGF
ncbi:hypothetical protein C7212DRAFT_344658 [Tuber magnatum]|uniref:Uncharacterized protein n=1 Tax=Tuber magnatum TaxID=42249 RepID=A0A317SN48_9PEZI|nr:hypothetical protein C7212DRAFT_344658 [Tuber magnatum]